MNDESGALNKFNELVGDVRKLRLTDKFIEFVQGARLIIHNEMCIRDRLIGLKGSSDPLGLSSTAVLAYDMDTNQVLYEKNADQMCIRDRTDPPQKNDCRYSNR